jgi:hypothetical protein
MPVSRLHATVTMVGVDGLAQLQCVGEDVATTWLEFRQAARSVSLRCTLLVRQLHSTGALSSAHAGVNLLRSDLRPSAGRVARVLALHCLWHPPDM